MSKTNKKQAKSPHAVEMNHEAIGMLQDASLKDVKSAYYFMESSKEGISPATAEERILKFGSNEVAHDKATSWFKQLIKSFINPFIFILLVIAAISFAVDVWWAAPGEKDFKTVIVVVSMVLISALLSFFRNTEVIVQLKS